MESLRIDIVNPKAKNILIDLAELNLIRIKKGKMKSEFIELLEKFRMNSNDAPSSEDIAEEVEVIRKKRNEE